MRCAGFPRADEKRLWMRTRVAATALVGVLAGAALVGCGSGTGSDTGADAAMSTTTAPTTTAEAKPPTISVKDGASGVGPWDGVKVASASKLQSVTMVNEQGREIDAEYNADKTTWEVAEPLGYGRTYTVTAKNSDGKTAASTFHTVVPNQQLTAAVGPVDGSTVGIAQAVTFRFNTAVKDTKAVEDAISVTTSNDTEGGFFWIDPYELRWRPKEFWQPHTEVTVAAELYGHKFGDGLWGGDDVEISFTIGDAVETVVDNADKSLSVYRDGELIKSFPIALGRDGSYDTPNGTYVVGDRHDELVMDSRTYGLELGKGGYVTPVKWATQLSYSGIYVHAAPWAAGAIGSSNVSHGCINASTEDAKWFLDTVQRGDPVIVKNTGGATLTQYDGLGYWNLDWETRSGGSEDPNG